MRKIDRMRGPLVRACLSLRIQLDVEYLGVRLPPVFEPEVRGVRIVKVVKHSPADRGGLRPGDRLLRVNGVRTPDVIRALVRKKLRDNAGNPIPIIVDQNGPVHKGAGTGGIAGRDWSPTAPTI